MKSLFLFLNRFLFVALCGLFAISCEKETFVVLSIDNPYEGIDFSSVSSIVSISHEHISNQESLDAAYKRGVRLFACVNYRPACPTFPLSNWDWDYNDYLSENNKEIIRRNYKGSLPYINIGNELIETDSIPQIPNAEHPLFCIDKNSSSPRDVGHFNVLGSLFTDCGWGNGEQSKSWRLKNMMYDVEDINTLFLDPNNQWINGKIFGTINHNNKIDLIQLLLDSSPEVFRAMEVFNQFFPRKINNTFRDTYDEVLRKGYRIWCVAAVDWQDYVEGAPLSEDNHQRECSFNRGCNVLLIPQYEKLNVQQKAEAGLDAYINGKYYVSGLGNHKILKFDVNKERICILVDGSPSLIKIISSLGSSFVYSNSCCAKIEKGMSYVRFEVYYENDFSDMDFIFTNPVFINYR